MTKTPNRLVPDEALPPYAYVPGKFPHPTRDPHGHSFGKSHPSVTALKLTAWPDCREYLQGIDLFNCGYYWEAHEAWETLWHAAGRRGWVADFLKGLIALAAAGVKAREGRVSGVKQHALRARQIFVVTLGQGAIETQNVVRDTRSIRRCEKTGSGTGAGAREAPHEEFEFGAGRLSRSVMGLNVNDLIIAAQRLVEAPEQALNTAHHAAVVVMPFALSVEMPS